MQATSLANPSLSSSIQQRSEFVDGVGGVILCLLEAVSRVFVSGFGFNHRQRKIAGIAEEIIGPLPGATPGGWTLRDDPAGCEIALFGDRVGIGIPTDILQERHDGLPACVGFGHGSRACLWTRGPQ